MAHRIRAADVPALRMQRHGLGGDRPPDVGAAVRHSGGIQAQDLAASRLAVRARSAGSTADAVAAACGERRAVVRTWLMRGTLHAVAADDVGWLLRLLGPATARGQRNRRAALGLDDAVVERALRELPEVLAGRALTRAALVAELRARGLDVDAGGQAPAHLVLCAATSGLICRAAEDGTEPTYALLEEWLGADRVAAGPEGAAAEVELAARYFAAFAPASVADLAAWAGWPAGTARRAAAAVEGLEPVDAGGRELLTPPGAAAPRLTAGDAWRLLPAFDSYLLGYRDRDLVLDPAHARRIQAGGGWLHPVVLHRGRAVGRWRLDRSRTSVRITVEWFGGVPRGAARALEREAADIGRFLGTGVRVDG